MFLEVTVRIIARNTLLYTTNKIHRNKDILDALQLDRFFECEK